MSSARIIPFPKAARRRPVRHPRVRVRSAARRSSRTSTGGFTLLLCLTIPAAFFYLSGAMNVARHDALYTALLVAIWGFYFASDKLLRTALGPLLVRAGVLLGLVSVVGFFGAVYWLILSHP